MLTLFPGSPATWRVALIRLIHAALFLDALCENGAPSEAFASYDAACAWYDARMEEEEDARAKEESRYHAFRNAEFA